MRVCVFVQSHVLVMGRAREKREVVDRRYFSGGEDLEEGPSGVDNS